MTLLRHSARVMMLFALPIVSVQVDKAQTASQPQAAPSSAVSVAPTGTPVSRAVLEDYLKATGTLEGNTDLTKMQLDASRKTLPAWFPQAVWDDVVHKVSAIDLVDVYLPVYRKYMNDDTLSVFALLYHGPTGEELGRISSRRMRQAFQNGLTGYAADMQGADAMAASGEDALVTKRLKEMTPEERANFTKAADIIQPILRQLDNAQTAAFSRKVNEVYKATLAAHNAELVAAKNAASHPKPAK